MGPRHAVSIAIGMVFIAAGIAHFTHAGFFESLVPAQFGTGRGAVNATTGVLTIGIGLAFLLLRLRRFARWLAITLLLLTLPVTAYRALHPAVAKSVGLSPTLLGTALVAWVSMIALVWWATKADDENPKL